MHMAGMQKIKAAIGEAHAPAAPAPAFHLLQGGRTRHDLTQRPSFGPERFQDFLFPRHRGANLTHRNARGDIGQPHGDGQRQLGAKPGSDGGHHRIPRARDILHLGGFRREMMQLIGIQQGHAVVTARHQHGAKAMRIAQRAQRGDDVFFRIHRHAGGFRQFGAVRRYQISPGIAVGKVGTAVTREEEILEALGPERGALRKVMSRSAALEQVERWRRRGWRVGFTNGCFDLLHPGHVHLLEQSRSWCDRLVVGLNSDDSVKRLKGPARPIQNEAARAAVLASLATVDCVTVFDEETPLELIRLFQPEVLVKGADYTVETVVGADIVQGYGGQVRLAQLLPGNSTTATVARMKG